MRAWLVLLAVACASGAHAAASEAGLQFAQKACAFQQVIAEDAPGADAASSFAAIAEEHGYDITAPCSFIADPYSRVPQFAGLSEQQVHNLIIYFRTLRD